MQIFGLQKAAHERCAHAFEVGFGTNNYKSTHLLLHSLGKESSASIETLNTYVSNKYTKHTTQNQP